MDLTLILNLMVAAAQLLPEIEQALPVVTKIIGGEMASAADAAAIHSAILALEAQVANREQAALA